MRNRAAHPAGYTDGAPGPTKDRTHTGSADVHNITDAPIAHSDDMHRRMVKYSLAMGIRLVCLFLIFVLPGWFKIIAIVGAVALPWFAVIIANGGSDTVNEHAVSLLDQAPLGELEAPGPRTAEGTDAGDGESPTLQGEVIPSDPGDDPTARSRIEGGRTEGGRTDGGRTP
ncbi:DUF3099 domain-containing protein [Paeniglutamicibacter antarcticus]|uniref:DUF3099 domain-containing protein n=1 Tax=Arthrobacter terrae TaxID=2935737 RepID=A0A931CN97_9MICC|nr:DUF3099 domain-containing protein [Arthrobacter terrae]MBG0739620.1 DUF3099 domain-containing protein [Arthrobacter terrae]